MKQSRRSLRVLLKYTLFQLPALLVLSAVLFLFREWVGMSPRLFWVVLGLWLLKDILLYPFVWRSYAPYEGPPPMVGLQGEARERIAPEGYVRVRGELWRARLGPGQGPIDPGGAIRVVEQRGLVLVVEAAEKGAGQG